LAKQRRGASRTVKTKKNGRKTAPARRSPVRPSAARASAKRPISNKRPIAKPRPAKAAAPEVVLPPPPVPPRKPGFYEAVAIYERGVQGLQRHDFVGAAELFRTVIDKYPEERELLERARLYLRVCERETARNSPPPETPAEQVYAATVALNAGDHATALHHLQQALQADPENDHAHYMMSTALSLRGRRDEALDHLQRAIELNPENRAQARQDPDLDNIRDLDGFRGVIDAAPSSGRRRVRRR